MKTYSSSIPEIKLKKSKTDFKKVKITRSQDAADYIRQFYSDDINIYESFFILLLNSANNTIGFAKISQGGVLGTVADPKIIAKYCIDSLCSQVILSHNHPSQNPNPSEEDKKMTFRIKEILSLLGVKVIDHIILTGEEITHFSFADEGIL